jgi:hypothetical protein
LYGTTSFGGSLNGGNIFRIFIGGAVSSPCTMLPLSRSGGNWFVNLTGTAGATYQVLRATNISGPWTPLTNVICAGNGLAQCLDTNPVSSRAFFRGLSQ